jgi:hypothetical protein
MTLTIPSNHWPPRKAAKVPHAQANQEEVATKEELQAMGLGSLSFL